jgi:hypothetical protein
VLGRLLHPLAHPLPVLIHVVPPLVHIVSDAGLSIKKNNLIC